MNDQERYAMEEKEDATRVALIQMDAQLISEAAQRRDYDTVRRMAILISKLADFS